MMQLSLLFQTLTENLSFSQVNFLKALLDEVQLLSAKDTLRDYNLGTSANVLRKTERLTLLRQPLFTLWGMWLLLIFF